LEEYGRKNSIRSGCPRYLVEWKDLEEISQTSMPQALEILWYFGSSRFEYRTSERFRTDPFHVLLNSIITLIAACITAEEEIYSNKNGEVYINKN
jgi:hypothetical protein